MTDDEGKWCPACYPELCKNPDVPVRTVDMIMPNDGTTSISVHSTSDEDATVKCRVYFDPANWVITGIHLRRTNGGRAQY